MANHTITAYSTEKSTEYYLLYGVRGTTETSQTKDGGYNIPLPDLKGLVIKSVSVTAPVISTRGQGGYGDFALKIGSISLGQWVDSTLTTWSADNLSIEGGKVSSITVDLKHGKVTHAEDRGGWGESHVWVGNTGREMGKATATIVVEGDFIESNIYPLSGDTIAKSLQNNFSWNQTIATGSVVSQKLYWKKITASKYNQIPIGNEATAYSFPAYTFDNGEINWYVEAIDDAGNIATSNVETVTVGIVPSVNMAYPVNVNIRNSNIQTFTWEVFESIRTGQKSYELSYKATDSSDWIGINEITSNEFHEFAANTFATNSYEWRLKVTNNDDLSSEYVYSTFVSIGATESPNIISVTNSAIPTITWEIESQDTFELEIYKATERLYSSGVQVGSDVRIFTPNIMLEDDNYIIKMRAMNQYGYFTEWSDYAFVLNSEKPPALNCYAYANQQHGVAITQSIYLMMNPFPDVGGPSVQSSVFVLRRVYGETNWDIIGKLSHSDRTDVFNDNTVISGVKYEYALRNYREDAGYTDSNIVSIILDFPGNIIYSGNDFVILHKTEDQQFEISHEPTKQFSYTYAIGRKYPIKESSEWMAENISMSCFVDFEQYKMLEKFYESNENLWIKGNNFSYQCSIDSIAIKETLWGKGYTLNLTISRTDKEELKLFE